MTGHDDADRLAEANLAYRRPSLYDELTAGDELAHTVARVASDLGVTVGTVLDLGCGTGRDLAAFASYGWAGVGVDLQAALLAHGRTVHPGLDLRVGDLRTVRLGRTFDLITCLGNVLAYLHTDTEIAAAAATFAAHAHPGTVLAVHTLTTPPPAQATPKTACVQTATVRATVTTCAAEWDPARMIHTTRRTWEFADQAPHRRRGTSAAPVDGGTHSSGRGRAFPNASRTRRHVPAGAGRRLERSWGLTATLDRNILMQVDQGSGVCWPRATTLRGFRSSFSVEPRTSVSSLRA
jgi:SAM-dependent methyltransferase